MPSIVTISKTGSLKNAQNNDGIENLYKKCGFKKDTDFQLRHEWTVKVGDESRKIKLFARNVGRAGTENKYDLPPPIDHDLYFGTMCIVMTEAEGDKQLDLKVEGWKKIYEALFGGFEDLGESDEEEEDELDDVPDSLKTSEGYLKDGFVVDASSDEEMDSETNEYVNSLITKKPVDNSDESECEEGIDAKLEHLSECSEEPYDYSDED
tara:strand:- start:4532 stop:5158 length:627 start_codon:yes stop_codon:yes gene_type:complete